MVPKRARIPLILFVGTLLMQSAWVLTLPPFRGSDEFDHAFKAASVTAGNWKPSMIPARNGRGEIVVVPKSLVLAANPICESYLYTGPDNCRPIRELDADQVEIASAASRYRSEFYWILGTAAANFEGSGALYAMRTAAALLCAAFAALAAVSLTLWARSSVPYIGLFVALSPVAFYSASVAAPNGVEIFAGAALWTSLMGLLCSNITARTQSALLWLSTPSIVVLASVRQLGPLFLAAIALAIIVYGGQDRITVLVRQHRRPVAVAILAAIAAVTTNVMWIKSVSQLAMEDVGVKGVDPLAVTFGQLPLWMLQTIAAFPLRDQHAPSYVYGAWALVLATLLLAAFWKGGVRQRLLILGVGITALAIPVALTLATVAEGGSIWQGRYGLPFAVGVPLIAALVLDTKPVRHALAVPGIITAALALAGAHTLSVQYVFLKELKSSPLSGDPSWPVPHPWAPAFLMALGCLLWILVLIRSEQSTRARRDSPVEQLRRNGDEPAADRVSAIVRPAIRESFVPRRTP